MAVEPEPARGLRFGEGTLKRALLMAAILALLALGVAAVWPERRPGHELDRLLRRGATAGAEALRQDLLARAPPGADSGPAVQHLVNLGFQCRAPEGPSDAWLCVQRRPEAAGRVTRIEVRIALDAGVTAGIAAAIREEALR